MKFESNTVARSEYYLSGFLFLGLVILTITCAVFLISLARVPAGAALSLSEQPEAAVVVGLPRQALYCSSGRAMRLSGASRRGGSRRAPLLLYFREISIECGRNDPRTRYRSRIA